MTRLPWGAAVVGPLWVFACDGTDSASEGVCTPDLASIQETVFVPACAGSGCHSGPDPAALLDLTASGLDGRLIDRPSATCDRILVVPGRPEDSFLVQKISHDAPECGTSMPIGAELDASQIACISDWIRGLPAGCETCGGGSCVDLMEDPSHCGDCDTVCSAGSACSAGECGCSVGTLCGQACVNTQTDPTNCGGCGTKCAPVQVCNLGSCANSCDPSLTQCSQSCIDTTSDPMHCGDCATSCGASGTCEASVCVCPGGGNPQTDPSNCGSCGNVCAPGQTCESGACVCGSASVSFAGDVQPIFTAHCATTGCHTGAMPKEGLHLGAGKAHAQLVNVDAGECTGRKRVLPGQPSDSYLMDKLLGVDLCSGTRMPKLEALAAADIETISSWICEGAPDN